MYSTTYGLWVLNLSSKKTYEVNIIYGLFKDYDRQYQLQQVKSFEMLH